MKSSSFGKQRCGSKIHSPGGVSCLYSKRVLKVRIQRRAYNVVLLWIAIWFK